MKILDRKDTYIQNKLNINKIIKSWFLEFNGRQHNNMVMCPNHEDTKPSMDVSPEGKAYCHGCGFVASNFIELYSKMEGLTYMEARKILYEMTTPTVPDGLWQTFEREFTVTEKPRTYIVKDRNISLQITNLLHLGYDLCTGRITIPIFDQFSSCVNIRYAKWLKYDTGAKMKNIPKHGACRLYPENLMVNEEKVLLVEGEFDALVGRSFDLPAVTWTCGATSWNDEHSWLFKDKVVFILYDNDEPGRKGAEMNKQKLQGIAREVIVLDPLCKEGKDLTDWSKVDPTKLEWLKSDIDTHEIIRDIGKNVCRYCGQEIKKGV